MPGAFYSLHKHDHWGTPSDLFETLNKEFQFQFDPCPYGARRNALRIPWKHSNFVNPPYSQSHAFAMKCRLEQLKGNQSVLLIPAHTSSGYFHQWVLPYAQIRFLKGRVKFRNLREPNAEKKATCAPFSSLVCVYRGAKKVARPRKKIGPNMGKLTDTPYRHRGATERFKRNAYGPITNYLLHKYRHLIEQQ